MTDSTRKGFWAKVILDSVGPQGNRLTTMEFTIPKRSWALRFLDAVETGHGKWPGWHQYRKDFPREYVTGYLKAEDNID